MTYTLAATVALPWSDVVEKTRTPWLSRASES